MGKFKEIIDIEKKNLPEYQFNFLYHRVMPGFIFILGGAIVALGLGIALYFIFHSELISFIPLIFWVIATIVLLILFVIYNRKYSIMLIDDKAKEFDKIYKLVDYDTAITKLKENKTIIDDTIFVEKSIYSFKDVNMFFFSKTLSGVYYFRIYINNKNDNQFITYLELDKNLLSYFCNNLYLISNYELFELFVTDKKRFLKYLYKYNDINKMYKKYLKESSLSFDQEKTLKENFGFLLYEYEFKFCKTNLGNLTDDDGKLIFYGPLNCYYIYNKKICINFMHLIQRQEMYIYITDTKSNNQSYIRKGYELDTQYCYNYSLLAAVIKNDITQNNRIFGKSIK